MEPSSAEPGVASVAAAPSSRWASSALSHAVVAGVGVRATAAPRGATGGAPRMLPARRGAKRSAPGAEMLGSPASVSPKARGQTSLRGFVGLPPLSEMVVAAEPPPDYARDAPVALSGALERWLDLMELPRTAVLTLADIKTQFRQKALAHHPDKGGTAEGFREIRDAYSAVLDSREKWAGGGSADEAEQLPQESGKGAALIMATCRDEDVEQYLKIITPAVLDALLQFMRDSMSDSGESEGHGREERGHAGFYRCGADLWQAKLAWRSWRVQSARLPQTRAWLVYCRLLEVQSSALRRHLDMKQKMQQLGRAVTDAEVDAGFVPLTEEELGRLRQVEPLAPFFYSSDIRRKRILPSDPDRVQSIFTPSLSAALEFRVLIAKTLGSGSQVAATWHQIDKLRDLIRQRVAADVAEHGSRQHRLLAAVEAEAARRPVLEMAALPAAGSHVLAVADIRDDFRGFARELRDEVHEAVREAKEGAARQIEEFQCKFVEVVEASKAQNEEVKLQLAQLEQQLSSANHTKELQSELARKDRQFHEMCKQVDALRQQPRSSGATFASAEMQSRYNDSLHQDASLRVQRERSSREVSRPQAAWQTAKEKSDA